MAASAKKTVIMSRRISGNIANGGVSALIRKPMSALAKWRGEKRRRRKSSANHLNKNGKSLENMSKKIWRKRGVKAKYRKRQQS
jgi:hypothetical protein